MSRLPIDAAGVGGYPVMTVGATTTRAPRYPVASAAWADHLGAVACMEPKCFPGS